MRPRPVVVDTNVVVSGLLTSEPDAPTARILDGMLEGRFVFLLSADLLSEYRQVLLRPKIRGLHGLAPEAIDTILTELAANAAFRDPPPSGPAPDRGDDHLWALAASEPDSLLVTGDRKLIDSPPPGTPVLSPRRFVDLEDR